MSLIRPSSPRSMPAGSTSSSKFASYPAHGGPWRGRSRKHGTRTSVLKRCASAPSASLISHSGPHAEVVESLRWARELIASGRAGPDDIAITSPSTREWDDHFLALSESAGLPVHFSHGVPALSTQEGQVCAALADVLVNGL